MAAPPVTDVPLGGSLPGSAIPGPAVQDYYYSGANLGKSAATDLQRALAADAQTAARVAAARAAGIKPSDMGPAAPAMLLPKGYAGCPFGTAYSLMARLKTCSGDLDWIITARTPNGAEVGQLIGRLLYEHWTGVDGWSSTVHISYRVDSVWGVLASGVEVTPSIICENCYVSDAKEPISAHIGLGGEDVFEAHLMPNGPIPLKNQVGMNFKIFTEGTTATSESSDVSPGVSHTARCQNQMATTGKVGCNINNVPGLVIYSTAPTSDNRGVALHIINAWSNWWQQWGNVDNGAPLHRTQSEALMAANSSVKNMLCGPRPAGYQCDEYPFASTYEGGWYSLHSTSGADLLPSQFSVQMVPAGQNRSAGGTLVGVYNSQAITNGEAFYVWIQL